MLDGVPLEIRLEMKHVVDAILAVNQTDMIADDNVAPSSRCGAEPVHKLNRGRPNPYPHFRCEDKSLVNVSFPFAVPVAALFMAEVLVVMTVPISSSISVVVIKSVMIVVVAILCIKAPARRESQEYR